MEKKNMQMLLLTILALSMNLTNLSAETLHIKLPVLVYVDAEDNYPLDLLKFLLDSTGREYEIHHSDEETNQSRNVMNLLHNQWINLLWAGTSAELENELVPIRFPVWRGLLGFRVFFINRDMQSRFSRINTLEDLQQYTGEQGMGWQDIAILEAAGLGQNETPYDQIIIKLQNKRSDYFSRGITEIFEEAENIKMTYPDIAIENHLLLTYPFAMFFFTNKENQELADLLENAFEQTYKDGTFMEFFNHHPVIIELFSRGNLDSRVRIEIDNPLLSDETLSIPEEYWLR